MEELDAIIKLAQGGATAVLVAANIAQWREIKRLTVYIQKLLDDQLALKGNQEVASRERLKIARAVGLGSLDDTIGKKPRD